MIKPSTLVLKGFHLEQDRGRLGKVFHGKGLRITLTETTIKILKMGLSCAIVHTEDYDIDRLEALIYGLQKENA